jgi:hypothetical protein
VRRFHSRLQLAFLAGVAHMWGRDDVQKFFAITQSGISYSVIDRTVHLSLVGNFNKHQTYL